MSLDEDVGDTSELQYEVDLLQNIFLDQVDFNSVRSELTFRTNSSSLVLRIPPAYPASELPVVISASVHGQDVRERMRKSIAECETGTEVLDVILVQFRDYSEQAQQDQQQKQEQSQITTASQHDAQNVEQRSCTMIVWLHHLLNTNKRKQVLSPAGSSVRGISKPGHPGVLLFTGNKSEVSEHVNALRQLKWQAFQIRHEEDMAWLLNHKKGVVEVETMSDVVSRLVSEHEKQVFMEALKIKS